MLGKQFNEPPEVGDGVIPPSKEERKIMADDSVEEDDFKVIGRLLQRCVELGQTAAHPDDSISGHHRMLGAEALQRAKIGIGANGE